MKPVDQLIPHDPDNGRFGDCVRATIASLLELSAHEVPHFMDGNPVGAVYNQRLNGFLAGRGLFLLPIPYFDFRAWREANGVKQDVFHAVSGPSPRFPDAYHMVVGKNGEPVFDPHPSRAMLREEDMEKWIIEFLVKMDAA